MKKMGANIHIVNCDSRLRGRFCFQDFLKSDKRRLFEKSFLADLKIRAWALKIRVWGLNKNVFLEKIKNHPQ